MEIEFLIKLGYYLCISPFRFRRNENNVEIAGSRIRKVLCCFLHIAGFLLNILVNTYPRMNALLRERNPKVLFDIAVLLTGQFHVVSVIYKLWYTRESFRAVIEEIINHDDLKEKRGSGLSKFVILAVMILSILFWMYPGGLEIGGITQELWGCPKRNTPNTNVPLMRWIKALADWGDDCGHPILVRVSTAVQMLFNFYFYVAWGFAYSMFLASSFSIYRIGANLNMIKLSSTLESPNNLKHQYKLAKYRMGMLNNALSITPLLATMSIVMYVSVILPWALLNFEIVSVVDLAMSLLVLSSFLVAAEGNRMMGEVENSIITAVPGDASNTALMLARCPGDVGLKGWHFFVVSYSFVGCVGAAMFTYVLVVMQYQQ